MEGGNSTYWATMAQVMPLFALAVVLEARAIAGKWNSETPTFVKAIQSIAWTFALATLAFGESVALRALRGEEPQAYWVALCETAISWSVGLLILAPTLQLLVKSFARPLAGTLTLNPATGLDRWRLERKIRSLNKSAETEVNEAHRLQEEAEAALRDFIRFKTEVERTLEAFDSHPDNQPLDDAVKAQRKYMLGTITRISAGINAVEEVLARIEQRRHELERTKEIRVELEKDFRKIRDEEDSVRREKREDLTNFFTDID